MKTTLASALLIAAALGCGGGSSPVPSQAATFATSLNYTDPGTGVYQLRRSPSLGSKGHLVLELWGPATETGSGVTLALKTDGRLAWTNVATGDAPGTHVAKGTVFDLGTGTPILKGRVSGDALVVTISEKGCDKPKPLGGVLLQVALDLKAANLPVGTGLTLSVDPARSKVLRPDGTTTSITVATGNIQAL